MKVYSILVLYKDADGSKPRLLKSTADLSQFSFFYKNNVGEFMKFTGSILAERSAVPSRSSIKEQEYLIHCYVRPDRLVGVCVTDQEYQSRVAFSMLTRVLDDFASTVPPPQWSQITDEKACKYEKLPELLTKWQNPREADALTKVQDEVEETKVVLHNTMQAVLDRGEKLDDLVKASENLSEQSKMFYTQARKLNKCCSWA
ncbi:Synaptobrevin YKT6 [Aphelenchoides avenae]|nr:Synaptobrevin YKT6 [Aphelenchus avenae]